MAYALLSPQTSLNSSLNDVTLSRSCPDSLDFPITVTRSRYPAYASITLSWIWSNNTCTVRWSSRYKRSRLRSERKSRSQASRKRRFIPSASEAQSSNAGIDGEIEESLVCCIDGVLWTFFSVTQASIGSQTVREHIEIMSSQARLRFWSTS